MEQRLYEALQRNPIIAAVRDDEGLAQCLRTDIQEKKEVMQALEAGALAISSTAPAVWQM